MCRGVHQRTAQIGTLQESEPLMTVLTVTKTTGNRSYYSEKLVVYFHCYLHCSFL